MKKILTIIGCAFVLNSSYSFASDKGAGDKAALSASGSGSAASGSGQKLKSIFDLSEAERNKLIAEKVLPALLAHEARKSAETADGSSNAASASGASASEVSVRELSDEEAAPYLADLDRVMGLLRLSQADVIGKEGAENASATAAANAAQGPESAAGAAPVLKTFKLAQLKDVMLHPGGTLLRKLPKRNILKAAFPIDHPSIEGFDEDVCTNAQCIIENGPHKYFYDMSHPAYKAMKAKTAANPQK